jgi:hypothetical protein
MYDIARSIPKKQNLPSQAWLEYLDSTPLFKEVGDEELRSPAVTRDRKSELEELIRHNKKSRYQRNKDAKTRRQMLARKAQTSKPYIQPNENRPFGEGGNIWSVMEPPEEEVWALGRRIKELQEKKRLEHELEQELFDYVQIKVIAPAPSMSILQQKLFQEDCDEGMWNNPCAGSHYGHFICHYPGYGY